jgi:hypothetical protein
MRERHHPWYFWSIFFIRTVHMFAAPFSPRSLPEHLVKKLLIMLILSICAVAWRSDDILNALGVASTASARERTPVTASAMTADQPGTVRNAMSVEQLAELSKSDPNAYRKFIASRTVNERTEADKLMNFLTRGKYE